MKTLVKFVPSFNAKLKAAFAFFCLFALTSVGAFAQGENPAPTLWSTAGEKVSEAATSLSTFLIAALVIPLAYFAWRMIKRAIHGA